METRTQVLIRKVDEDFFILDSEGKDLPEEIQAKLSGLREGLSGFETISFSAIQLDESLLLTEILEVNGEDWSVFPTSEQIELLTELLEAKREPPEQTVELFKPFTPLKARTGYGLYEFNREEDLYELWAKERLGTSRAIAVQAKFDGMRLILEFSGKKVAIYTEDRKRDRAEILPEIVEEVRTLKVKSAIFDTEFVIWKENQPIPRREMIRLIVGKEPIRGEDIHVNIHDCLFLNGRSLIHLPYSDRLKALKRALPSDKKFLKKAETWTARTKTEFFAALKKASGYPGSEGGMCKTLDSDYSIKGKTREETSEWAKIKHVSELHAQIIGIQKKPNPWPSGQRPSKNLEGEEALKAFKGLQGKSRTFIYRCGIRSDSKLLSIDSEHKLAPGDLTLKWDAEHEGGVWKGTDDPEIWQMAEDSPHRERGEWAYGNTYSIALDPAPKLGGIITVTPILMRSWRDTEGKTHYSWTFPRVREFDPTRTKPNSTEDAEAIVKRSPKSLRKSKVPRPFGHPGGKTLMLKHILPLIPPHETYCEPYSGAATVFFAKDKAKKSVLGEIDPEIVFALRFVKNMTNDDIDYLKKQNWRPSRGRWKFLYPWKPLSKRDKFYRFLYLNFYSWADTPRKGFAAGTGGTQARSFIKKIPDLQDAKERLQGVSILQQDAFKTMKEHDSPETLFYCDPPYPGSGDLKAFAGKAPDPKKLASFLGSLKGKWLLSFMDTPENRAAFKSFNVKVVTIGKRYSTFKRSADTSKGMQTRKELLISNYDLTSLKKSAQPEIAEKDKGWCVTWGEQIICYDTRAEALVFAEENPDTIQIEYRSIPPRTRIAEGVYGESLHFPKVTAKHPEEAEDGFGWCVTWADGRAIACYRTHTEATKFAKLPGPLDAVKFEYREMKKGWRRRGKAPTHAEFLKEAVPKGEGEPMTRQEQRTEAETKFGDPYLVHQPPDKKFSWVYMTHDRGIWSKSELKALRAALAKAKDNPDLIKEVWKDYEPAILTISLEELTKKAQAASDAKKDVSAVVRTALDTKPPEVLSDLSKLVNLGNAHGDWRKRSPEGEWLIGMTLNTPSVLLQFLDGRIEYLLRDKFLSNQEDDKILAQRKCPNDLCDEERYLHLVESDRQFLESAVELTLEGQDLTLPEGRMLDFELTESGIRFLMEPGELREAVQPLVWLTIVNPRRIVYWAPPAAVGATRKTAARFVFRDRGEIAYGCIKDDYHENFVWFSGHKNLSGRWGSQLLPSREEYLKIGKGEWWMVNRVYKNPQPYILQYSRESKERQARKEGLKNIIWNANLLKVLQGDKTGRKWLGKITQEKLDEKYQEFSEDKGEWHLRKSLSFGGEFLPTEPYGRALYVYGPFLIPDEDFGDGHKVSEEEIAKAIRAIEDLDVEVHHSEEVPEGSVRLTQIFQAPGNFRANGTFIKKGAGVAEFRILSPVVQRKVLTGELRGLSIDGSGRVANDGGLYDIQIKKLSLVSKPAVGVNFVVDKD